jgi:predicted dehydrogenase
MLQGALIGVGHVARNGHLPGWLARDDTTLVAAGDARPDGREAFLAAFPRARWYESAKALLAAERPDFVDICTPPSLHAPLAGAALAAGCHVLCEKPLGISPQELDPLSALAGRSDRALVTVHNWSHAPALAKATELVRAGAIGRIRSARWETLRTRPAVAAGAGNWRADPAVAGGGVLVDHGWHALYVLRRWLGGRPQSLSARLERRKHPELAIEDTAEISMEWGGARVRVFLTWAADRRGNLVALEGEKGRLTLDGGFLTLSSDGAASRSFDLPSLAEGSHHPEWFHGVIDDFLREVRDPAARGENLGEAALCATLLALSQESSRGGGASLAVPAA